VISNHGTVTPAGNPVGIDDDTPDDMAADKEAIMELVAYEKNLWIITEQTSRRKGGVLSDV
jgi:hypothetical protein